MSNSKFVFGPIILIFQFTPIFAQTLWNPPAGFEDFPDQTPNTLTQFTTANKRVQSRSGTASKKAQRVTDIYEAMRCLQTQMDMKQLQKSNPMKLRKVLRIIHEELRKRGKDLPFLINTAAFRYENPDAPVEDSKFKFPKSPAKMELSRVLRILLSQVNTQNATFVVRPDHIEITTFYNAHPSTQLGYSMPIMIRNNVSRLKLLREIFERTGIDIVIDPQQAHKLRHKISAIFVNDVTIGTAIKRICSPVGLSVVVIDRTVWITTPEEAKILSRKKQYPSVPQWIEFEKYVPEYETAE